MYDRTHGYVNNNVAVTASLAIIIRYNLIFTVFYSFCFANVYM